jgi:acyl-coenzyme A thioesterase PaaI-like protein
MTTYPPDHHVLRDLRYETERLAPGHVRGVTPVQPGVLASDGSMRASAIAMTVDVAAAAVAIVAAAPDWSATADLAYWGVRPVRTGPLVCDAHLVRAGSGSIVVEVDVTDAQGDDALAHPAGHTPAGRARLTFSRIPGSASAASARLDRTGDPTPRRGIHRPDTAMDDPLFERCGIAVVDAAAGVVQCAKADYIRNSFGTINGGVIGVIAEAAAELAARHATGEPLVARDLHVHYLAQTKVGPARTSCRVLRTAPGHALVEVRIVDAGNAGTVLALATVGLGR